MLVHIEREKKEKKIRFNGTVNDLLKQLKINPDTVLVTRENELLTQDDKIDESDKIKILSVISGG